MTDIVELLRSTTEQMASNCSVDMTLWCEHSGAALEAAAEIELLRLSLSEARATGRREGLSEAARIGYWVCAETRHVTLGDNVAAAIRAAMEKDKLE